MRKIKIYSFALVIAFISVTGCKKNSKPDTNTTTTGTQKIAPTGFSYATTNDVSINLTLKAPNNEPVSGVIVHFFNPADTTQTTIFSAATDKSGSIRATITLPSYLTQLGIAPSYLGLPGSLTAKINNKSVTATIGGTGGFSGDIIPSAFAFLENRNLSEMLNTNHTKTSTVVGSTDFEFPAPYTSISTAIFNTTAYPASAGRPVYISKTPTPVSALTLSYINSSFPDGQNQNKTHPQYLLSSVPNTVNVIGTADVQIAYLSGLAGYNNTLAYYTYPTNNPPTSVAQIKNATYIFPNTSNNSGSSKLLQPGDTIDLGTFNSGTTIAFILIVNGWNGSGPTINATNNKWYSTDALNSDKTRHSIQVYDANQKLYYIGFEDATGSADWDYNDVVFTTIATPVTNISNTGVAAVDPGTDSDGDGVPDALDAYPNDPTKAYNNYYPSATGYAQIAFEDNWPLKGDYDMNDLVVNYRYNFVSNAQNQIVTMEGDFSVAAAGASYKNGLGIQLPVSPSMVKSVTGQKAISSYITLASNGVEAGQGKAVIIPFDNYNALINNPDNSFYINTQMSKPKVTSSTETVLVTFTTPVDPTVLTVSALNPFLISNLRRGYEVHLPNYAATDLANKSLFGTGNDGSVPSSGITYVSTDNWPFALNTSSTFSYPVEGVNISQAYLHFLDWAGSGGNSFLDWYTNTASGYRNNTNVYSE